MWGFGFRMLIRALDRALILFLSLKGKVFCALSLYVLHNFLTLFGCIEILVCVILCINLTFLFLSEGTKLSKTTNASVKS